MNKMINKNSNNHYSIFNRKLKKLFKNHNRMMHFYMKINTYVVYIF